MKNNGPLLGVDVKKVDKMFEVTSDRRCICCKLYTSQPAFLIKKNTASHTEKFGCGGNNFVKLLCHYSGLQFIFLRAGYWNAMLYNLIDLD